MIKLKYNEIDYAKTIEEKGFLTNYHTYELTILIKYWKSQGIKPKQRKEKAYEFCEKYIENFNDVKYFKRINYALRKGSRRDNPLIIINNIPITDKEIEYINSSNIGYDYKKILFSLLVNMKIKKEICKLKYSNYSGYNYIGGSQKVFNDILNTAKIPNMYKINDIINILSQLDYIDVRTRGKINLLFIENIEDSDNIVLSINTYDNIGYYFDLYNGDKKIIKCIDCGKLIKQSKNKRKKYCSECWKEKQKEWQREAWHKNKEKYRPAKVLETINKSL